MIAKAEAKYIRISPQRARQVIDLVKGNSVLRALSVLAVMNKKGAALVSKVIKSALANAKNKGYEEDSLFISNAIANAGPMLKRYQAASFGRASVIQKKTSHIRVELDARQAKVIKPAGKKTKKVKTK